MFLGAVIRVSRPKSFVPRYLRDDLERSGVVAESIGFRPDRVLVLPPELGLVYRVVDNP